MPDVDKQELARQVAKELKGEYVLVCKEDWRTYLVRTFAAIFLLGGVTFGAVLAVVWSSATAKASRTILDLADKAEKRLLTLKQISVSSLQVVDENENVVISLQGKSGTGTIKFLNPHSEPRLELGAGTDFAHVVLRDKDQRRFLVHTGDQNATTQLQITTDVQGSENKIQLQLQNNQFSAWLPQNAMSNTNGVNWTTK